MRNQNQYVHLVLRQTTAHLSRFARRRKAETIFFLLFLSKLLELLKTGETNVTQWKQKINNRNKEYIIETKNTQYKQRINNRNKEYTIETKNTQEFQDEMAVNILGCFCSHSSSHPESVFQRSKSTLRKGG